jgi:serine/threonine protein kinase
LFLEVKEKGNGCHLRNIRVLDLQHEAEVRAFAERLQLEKLDTHQRLFVKLHEIAVCVPGRMAVVEDAIQSDLWEQFAKVKPGPDLVGKVRAVADAVLTGLSRLHAHGWAHCGITPHSVVLCHGGSWKLTGLEAAKRVRSLTGSPTTALSPEAVLGLTLTEKIDVWQLGAALSEAITRQRLYRSEEDEKTSSATAAPPADLAQLLCRLIDFVGPLPKALVDGHPMREDYFTPDGHVLRPVTPDAAGNQQVEAITPAPAPTSRPPSDGAVCPRPRQLEECLADTEGLADILEFISRCLILDPDQRPSAAEAQAHHFVRFANSKGVKIQDDAENGTEQKAPSKPPRKGTGFVQKGDLPDSDSDDDPKQKKVQVSCQKNVPSKEASQPKDGHAHAKIQDAHGDNESKLVRKGTGFVHMGELPLSDSEDEEKGKSNVKIQDSHGDSESTLVRKGTGFVHLGDLPLSDDDDSDHGKDEHAHAKIQDAHGDNESTLVRKGTGFVHLGDLPLTDSEDEEEEKRKNAVKIQDTHGDGESKLVRKGTGFVHISDLQLSEDEDDDDCPSKSASSKKCKIEVAPEEHVDNKIVRKGTGFVHMGELPMSDDEDEDDVPAKKSGSSSKKCVIQEAPAQHVENKIVRKGTGFVHIGEIPCSDDEDDDEPTTTKKKLVLQDAPEHAENKIVRKGTGFVNINELPQSSDEEDEPANKTSDKKCVIQETTGHAENKIVRKGTGFVHMGELPMSDDEDEDEDPKKKEHAKIQDSHGDNESKLVRKGTGFVHMGELPMSDDEEEEGGHAKIQDTHGDNENTIARKGTGFVNLGDMPPSSDEEDEQPHAKIAADTSGGEKNNVGRKGTGFVRTGDLPPSDDDDDD